MSRAPVVFIGIVVLALGLFVADVLSTVVGYSPTPPRLPTNGGPPIHLCDPDIELWSCIKDASYRRDL